MLQFLLDKSLHYFPNLMLLITIRSIFSPKRQSEKPAFCFTFLLLCILDWIRLNSGNLTGLTENWLYVGVQLLIVLLIILISWCYGMNYLHGWSLYKLLTLFMWWFCYESSRVVAFRILSVQSILVLDIPHVWLCLIMQDIFVVLCSIWIIRLGINYTVHISKSLILILGILSMVVEGIVYNDRLSIKNAYFSAGPAIILYIMFSFLFLYWCIAKIVKQMENERKNETYRLLKEMELRSVTQSYEETKRLRHEIRNQLLVMDTLISEERYEELKQILQRFNTHVDHLFQKRYCENQMLNAILNYEGQKAAKHGIELDILALMPKETRVDLIDLTTLLVNLIDNAIEASAAVKNSKVYVSVKKEKNYIFVKVCNRVLKDVLKENPNLQTTKKEKHLHGNGIALIKMIIDAYDGDIHFSQSKEEFQVSAMIKDEETRSIE